MQHLNNGFHTQHQNVTFTTTFMTTKLVVNAICDLM
jgi:hypothetical protein